MRPSIVAVSATECLRELLDMRIAGREIKGSNVETIIIPRGEKAIVFKAQALLDETVVEALCPRPKPRVSIGKGGKRIERTEEKSYQDALNEWGERRVAWLVLKSLEATEDLEWDTVDLNDPNTWLNYKQELIDAGFSDAERARIIEGVMAANGLSESKVEEARQRFLLSMQEESEA